VMAFDRIGGGDTSGGIGGGGVRPHWHQWW
jgi:hypothetical protein